MGVVGCASSASPVADVVSALVSERFGSAPASSIPARPDPRYRYLRVEVEGRPAALLVLGYVDPHPGGDIEVWYSAKREVIKTQNGRIVGTFGLEVDWRSVRFAPAPPAWSKLAPQGSQYQYQYQYQRLRDEMPGHRYAVTEQLALQPWQGTPPLVLPAALPAALARGYGWFRESTLSSTAQVLPPAWFALGVYLGQTSVVYSEQCLALHFCLKLLRWPLPESAS